MVVGVRFWEGGHETAGDPGVLRVSFLGGGAGVDAGAADGCSSEPDNAACGNKGGAVSDQPGPGEDSNGGRSAVYADKLSGDGGRAGGDSAGDLGTGHDRKDHAANKQDGSRRAGSCLREDRVCEWIHGAAAGGRAERSRECGESSGKSGGDGGVADRERERGERSAAG